MATIIKNIDTIKRTITPDFGVINFPPTSELDNLKDNECIIVRDPEYSNDTYSILINLNPKNLVIGTTYKYNINITDDWLYSLKDSNKDIEFRLWNSNPAYIYFKNTKYEKAFDSIAYSLKIGREFSLSWDTISYAGKPKADDTSYKYNDVLLDDVVLQKSIAINNKSVKSMSFAGIDVTEITIEGHDYNFPKDITITQQEVEDHIKAHTTWANDLATIDESAKLKGLSISSSLPGGIKDGESVTISVIYDSSVSDTLNGGTSDVVFSNIVIANPDRTVVEADVTSYIDANINWSGDSGNLDVTQWASSHPGTKLYIADLHMVDATEYTFTVQADHGYTVNGGASFDVKHTVYSIPIDDYWTIEDGETEIKDKLNKVLYTLPTSVNGFVIDYNGDFITWFIKNIYKNDTSIYDVDYPGDLCLLNKDIYWATETGIVKNGKKIYNHSYYQWITLCISKNGDVYYGGPSNKIFKNGVELYSYQDYISTIFIDNNDNLFTTVGDNKIYKNDTLFYELPSGYISSNNITIDTKGNIWWYDNTNNLYKNDTVFLKNVLYPGSIVTNINGDVYFTSRLGINIIRNDKVINVDSNSRERTFIAIINEYGPRTGNW